MSFLAPLFALGLLAIAAPIIFHLIRRRPKGQVQFSSLMFLSPTPPRFSRRSRPNNILLLLLRIAAVALLALAFMRPLLRWSGITDPLASEQRWIAIVLDTSASMRRGDLWQKALTQANEVLDQCKPTDQVGVYVFDDSCRPLLGFKEAATLQPTARQSVARERLKKLKPTWASTDLGRALSDVLDRIVNLPGGKHPAGASPHAIVLISDLQQGSRLEALREREWPARVRLDLKTVRDDRGNASLHLLRERAEQVPVDGKKKLRVRIFSDPETSKGKLTLSWVDGKGKVSGDPIEVDVPPGASRVVRVTQPADAGNWVLQLKGDAHPFDNRFFIPEPAKDAMSVLYLGKDRADDAAGLRFYLEGALGIMPNRKVKVVSTEKEQPTWEQMRTVPLVVTHGEVAPDTLRHLARYLAEGGTVTCVITTPGKSGTLARLAKVKPWEIEEARGERYAMLEKVDFEHPLFAPFAGPKFGDFTRIHFWKHRRLSEKQLGQARVLARFDNGDPAILQKSVGKGKLVVFASGWHPTDSQLARSSKFFPMMAALLDLREGTRATTSLYHVGDPARLPTLATVSEKRQIHKPDGKVVMLTPRTVTFSDTDQPGLYAIPEAGSFAVNLDPLESKTAPLPVETLEQMGARLVGHGDTELDADELKQMKDAELESRQKVWRWLVLLALGILFVETCLAGWLGQARPTTGGEAVTP